MSATAESIMNIINSLPHEEKWKIIHSLERSFEKEKQKMHDESEPIVHYEAIIETDVKPEKYRDKDGDTKAYKLNTNDYKIAREMMTDRSCWFEMIKRVMEEAYPYTRSSSYNIPLKNLSVKLNNSGADDHIRITLSWDSWKIEGGCVEKEMDKVMRDCPHYLFMGSYEFHRFRFSEDFTLRSLEEK